MPAAALPALLTLFCGSGAAALIYEIVWLQQLELVIGASAPSMGVLLGTFMGGMCIGSALAPRLISSARRPLRVYAALELAIAAMALAILAAMPLVDRVYAAWGGGGAGGLLVRELVAALCLLPPTLAMGAALPIAARAFEATRTGIAWVGWMYAANTAGAVMGALGAGFYLLRVHDTVVATLVAAAINLIVAAMAFALPVSAVPPGESPHRDEDRVDAPAGRARARRRVLVAIALSGFCALAGEVVWTRVLTLLFGATVYTFSIIVAVFLVGIGLGSGAGAALVKRMRDAETALGLCQWASALAVAWAAYALASVLPYWRDSGDAGGIWLTMGTDVGRTTFAILPAATLWGASFPLAVAAAADADAGLAAARVYAANTSGAVAGALLVGVVLVGRMGTQRVEWLMIALAATAGAMLLRTRGGRLAPSVAAAAIALACAAAAPALPPILVAYGRHAASWSGHAGEIVYVGEGANASVAVSRTAGGALNYHNAGKIQASSEPQDMRLQRMLGHLTTLVPASPRSVLVIGCGAGVTAGAVSLDPRVEQVTIAEIEPLVPQAAGNYFGSANWDVIRNPKVRVRIDDARHFLLTTTEKFDAITSDPLDPWVKGAAMLYTSEFFELAKAHLNPGGVMTVFVQLYESSPETVKSEAATFFHAFPNGTIWGNTYDGATGDTVLLGQADGQPLIDVDAIERQLLQPAFAPLRRSLGEVGFFSALELFGTYGGRAPELGEWLRDASLNTDRNLRLQYLAGLGFNLHAGGRIYADILKYRTFPDDLFAASAANIREAIEGPRE